MKPKYLNLGLIFCVILGSLLTAYPTHAQEPGICTFDPAPGWFWSDPAVPSIFDWVTFGFDGCSTPEGWVCAWDFGNGIASNECFAYQAVQYKQDGDYTVNVQVTFGEDSFSITQSVSVRTHDVTITKFTVPQSASVGQTRSLVVNVSNSRYPENIQVELYKSTWNGYVLLGSQWQSVPVRPAKRTTAFTINYTFTAEDARLGKVTFKAVAILLGDVRDALPLDNEAIALPTRVSR